MNPEQRAALRLVAEALPTGSAIPVVREHLLALLGDATPPNEGLLDIAAVAARLGMGAQWVYRHKRQLGAVKVGRSVRFSARAIDRFVARRAAP